MLAYRINLELESLDSKLCIYRVIMI